MTIHLTFLSGALPLTKTIEKKNNEFVTTPYPHLKNFTSTTHKISTLVEMHKLIAAAANDKAKPCLLKGTLQRPLVDEPRAGSTNTDTASLYAVLDLDKAKFTNPDEFMKAVGLDDISHIVQYSSSYKLGKSKALSCHIFIKLSRAMAAPQLKAWLMGLNLDVKALSDDLSLSPSGAALHWPLDITVCQNDKLIFIATPVFIGMKSPIPDAERVQYVKRKLDELPVERIALRPMDALKKRAREILNTLRVAAGMNVMKAKTTMVGEFEVQGNPGEATISELKEERDFVYLNLNGGDSWGYYHPVGNFEYIHNFKGEPSYKTKELLPSYYADQVQKQAALLATPTAGGELLLAFREKKTAQYWKGTWNPESLALDIFTVKSEVQLEHYLMSHGRNLGPFIPEWEMVFDPRKKFIVDEEARMINTFIPTRYMRETMALRKKSFPQIQRMLDSVVGPKGSEEQEHFLNWLAVIFQLRKKPMTAWILHGTTGTGKGALINKVLKPIFGQKYVVTKRAKELNQDFNGWLEQALIAFVDEISVDMFTSKESAESDLLNYITEPTLSVRRMRTDSYEVASFTAFIFSSNKPQPVRIQMNDRRYNVGQFQKAKLIFTDAEWDAIDKEVEGFAQYLGTRVADAAKARTVLETQARADIMELGVTSVDETAEALNKGNLIALWEAMPDEQLMNASGILNPTSTAYISLIKRFASEAVSRVSRDEVRVIFEQCVGRMPEGANKFTSLLRHHGIRLKRMRTGAVDDPRPYGLEIEWDMTPAQRKEITDSLTPPKPGKKNNPGGLKRIK